MFFIILTAAFFGIVQGLSEFLPISSSAHLLILHNLLHAVDADSLIFDAALHLGTLLALLLFFAQDIRKIIIAFFRSLSKRSAQDQEGRLAWYIIIGSIPAALVGYFGESVINELFRNLGIVAATLAFGGILFLLVERFGKQQKDLSQLSFFDALIIGLSQALALVPGISRSGITLVAGMARKLQRTSAVRFSFLLSIPVVFAAGAKKMFDALKIGMSANESIAMIIGIIFSAIAGIVAIRVLLVITQRYSLRIFAWYRFALAAGILLVLLIFR